jgi:Tfp pilus assembly protein PilO
MNKNIIPLLLIVIAVGIYFSFTRVKIDELTSIEEVNAKYEKAIDDFTKVTEKREALVNQYNSLNIEDRERLDKIIPDNVDNVRLIIDVNGVAARHGLSLKDVKSNTDLPGSGGTQDLGGIEVVDTNPGYNTVTLSFKVKGNYQNFVEFLEDIEKSLRIIDVSKIELNTIQDSSAYDYQVEIKTYWLKEIK